MEEGEGHVPWETSHTDTHRGRSLSLRHAFTAWCGGQRPGWEAGTAGVVALPLRYGVTDTLCDLTKGQALFPKVEATLPTTSALGTGGKKQSVGQCLAPGTVKSFREMWKSGIPARGRVSQGPLWLPRVSPSPPTSLPDIDGE